MRAPGPAGIGWTFALAMALASALPTAAAHADQPPDYCTELTPDPQRPYAPVDGKRYCEGFFLFDTSGRRADVYLLGYAIGTLHFRKSSERFVRLSVPSLSAVEAAQARFLIETVNNYPQYRLDGVIDLGSVDWDLTRHVAGTREIIVENLVMLAWVDGPAGQGVLPIRHVNASQLDSPPPAGPPIVTLRASEDLAELCWWLQRDGASTVLEGPRIKGRREVRPEVEIGHPKDMPIRIAMPQDTAGWATLSLRPVLAGTTDCSRRVSQFRVYLPGQG